MPVKEEIVVPSLFSDLLVEEVPSKLNNYINYTKQELDKFSNYIRGNMNADSSYSWTRFASTVVHINGLFGLPSFLETTCWNLINENKPDFNDANESWIPIVDNLKYYLDSRKEDI